MEKANPKKMAKRFYDSMMEDCYNQDAPGYKYYGALGCTVCDEWKNNFDTFYNDVKDDAGFMRSLELKTGVIYPAIRYEEDPIREFNKDSIAFPDGSGYTVDGVYAPVQQPIPYK